MVVQAVEAEGGCTGGGRWWVVCVVTQEVGDCVVVQTLECCEWFVRLSRK